MAYVNYMEIGKEVFVAGIGGVAAGYLHFQFLTTQFAGQMVGPIKTTTIIDFIVALIIGIGSTIYLPKGLGLYFGWGVAGTVFALGLMDQLGILPGAAATRIRVVRPTVARPVVAAATARGVTRLGTSKYTPTTATQAGRYTLT
ncbi:hypothetical protein CH330_01410 [candidate division WOR-3 bacterium JGI_Cruoil_03_51_56]|uniref:Uncharacterized protein n=1 Tax=candidate division WOR-3 bacterium JGI_Cruoil_03_51_56 TaxID=1973747 RepID=A0A235BXK7_UNCW3|nr:MAG: hypothetical protein CH330_01410 [candidate division WOR-3 bacterium JGI_Cruoil_03_51_56]